MSEADLENDRLRVRYDSAKVTEQALLQAVKDEGFDATIIAHGGD